MQGEIIEVGLDNAALHLLVVSESGEPKPFNTPRQIFDEGPVSTSTYETWTQMGPKPAISCVWAAFFGTLAFQGRFVAIFFQDLGMTNTEIGVLIAVQSIIGLVAKPAWAALCDRSQQHRLVLLFNIVLSAFSVILYSTPWTGNFEMHSTFSPIFVVSAIASPHP